MKMIPLLVRWPRRLRHQTLLLLVAITLPAMLALYQVSVHRQEAVAMASSRQWADALARSAASASAQWLALRDLAGLEAMLREIAAVPGVQRIEVVDAEAATLLSLNVDEHGRVRAHWAGAEPPDAHRHGLQAWAAVGRGGSLGNVGVSFSLDGERARLDSLRYDALAGMALVGLLIIASVYALLTRALAPLSRLMHFARALPQQPGATLPPQRGALELSELGRALNEASALLQRQFDALRAGEQRTQAIVNAVPDAIIGTDAQGRVTIASPAVASVFGQDADDLIGRPLHALLPGLDATEVERRTLEGLYIRSSGLHVARFDGEALRHDGTRFPVAVSLSRADADGEIRYACMVRDLTEQRMAEEMLNLYSQALECTSNGVVISDLSLPGQPVFYANPAFYRITGYDAGEAIGRNCAFLQRGDTAQPQIDELRQAVQERRATTVVLRNYRKDGTLFFNELAIAPVTGSAGAVRHYVGVVNDVTERERARLAIAERSARLNAVFDLSPDGFVVFDRDGQLVYTNRAFQVMTGWDDSVALQGLTMQDFDLRLRELRDPVQPYPPLTLQAAGDDDLEAMDLLHLGLPRPRVLTRLVRHNAGGQGESILYFRDVTHETEVDRMKSEFLTTAAHELRTPMVSVFGFTELLLNRPVPEGKRRDVLQTIHRQASLLINMVNELLDLARIEARQGKDLQRAPHALGPLVRGVIDGMRGHEAARPVAVDLGHAEAMLVVDADKVQRALGNVLSNAYKYSPKDADVRLHTLDGDVAGARAVGIRITDRGIGMSSAQLARVFERFYRADPSGNIPGTGLGMSLVKEIVELHGGRVDVDSTPGAGTAVTLWIPIADAATEASVPT
jgi:PAS domain S-box-containing protein